MTLSWQATHGYTTHVPVVGDFPSPGDVVDGGGWEVEAWARYATSGSSEPDWGEALIFDGEAVWEASNYDGSWAPSLVFPTTITEDGSVWQRWSGIFTAEPEPVWVGVPYGDTVTDGGGVVWRRIGRYAGDWLADHTYTMMDEHMISVPGYVVEDAQVWVYVRPVSEYTPIGTPGSAGQLFGAQWSERPLAVSGETEPVWHTAEEGSVTYDNEVVWFRTATASILEGSGAVPHFVVHVEHWQ